MIRVHYVVSDVRYSTCTLTHTPNPGLTCNDTSYTYTTNTSLEIKVSQFDIAVLLPCRYLNFSLFTTTKEFPRRYHNHTVHRIVAMNPGLPGGAALIPPNGAPPPLIPQAEDPQDQLLERLSNNLADAHNRAIDLANTRGPRVVETLAEEWMRQIKSLFEWVNAFRLPET